MSAVKEAVRRLADELTEDATWDDVMERVYELVLAAEGLEGVREGRVPLGRAKPFFAA